MSTIHLDALIASIRDDMAPIAEQKDIIITASASPAQIDGMEDAIRLMITNLTDNAIRYTPQGGRIELSSSIVNGRSVVRVSDNGPGIAPDERARVFDRFYRALGTKRPEQVWDLPLSNASSTFIMAQSRLKTVLTAEEQALFSHSRRSAHLAPKKVFNAEDTYKFNRCLLGACLLQPCDPLELNYFSF